MDETTNTTEQTAGQTEQQPEELTVIPRRDAPAADTPAPETGTEGQPAEGENDGNAAPEKYEFTMPEGYEVDDAAMEQITPVLRDLGLTQEQAQKLADFHFGQLERLAAAQEQARAEMQRVWIDELKADKEIGGTELKSNLATAGRLLLRYGSADLDTLLKESGLDKHPAVVRFLVKAGRELAEDRWADGGKRGPTVRTAGDVARQLFDKTL